MTETTARTSRATGHLTAEDLLLLNVSAASLKAAEYFRQDNEAKWRRLRADAARLMRRYLEDYRPELLGGGMKTFCREVFLVRGD